jgi:purine-binding chemotaxis protein CheW
MRNGSKGVTRQYLTIYLGKKVFGIPILQVQDILSFQKLTPIPLAPNSVAGVLNLRGRIVTAINLRVRLQEEDFSDSSAGMSVVVEHEGALFSLIVDNVGEVLTLSDDDMEDLPVTLDRFWHEISNGVYQLDGHIMIILDINRVLDLGQGEPEKIAAMA